MIGSFEAFQQAVDQQGLVLTDEVVDEGRQHDRRLSGGGIYWPTTTMMCMVEAAAQTLEAKPATQLLQGDEPLKLNELPVDEWSQSFGAMANAAQLAAEDRQTPVEVDFKASLDSIDSCSDAERGFVKAWKGARFFERWGMKHPRDYTGVRLVVDHEARPILMQKAAGSVHSALTLRQTYLNGIPIPAGSIVRVRFIEGFRKTVPDRGVLVAPAAAVRYLAFQRLSVFAAEPAERPITRWEYGRTVAERRGMRRLTIDEIADTAERAAHRAIARGQLRKRQYATDIG